MDSFEWNKIIGAVLGTVLFVVALYILVDGMMAPQKPTAPGMEVAVTEQPTTPDGTPTVEAPPDWGTLLPAADLAAGENVAKRCLQCHDFAKGGPHKIGPNQWGIVGDKHARAPDYAYSPAMRATADQTWDYDGLNKYLVNPKAAISGNKMAFVGLSKLADRVNLIAYMRTLSDAPAPIPPPSPAAPAPEQPAAPATDAPAESDGPAGEVQAPPPGTATPTPPATTPAPTPPGGGGH